MFGIFRIGEFGVILNDNIENLYTYAALVMGNLGRVLKTWVSGFDFKKPGSGFGFSKNTKFEFFY